VGWSFRPPDIENRQRDHERKSGRQLDHDDDVIASHLAFALCFSPFRREAAAFLGEVLLPNWRITSEINDFLILISHR
jgi:hypothetical protein